MGWVECLEVGRWEGWEGEAGSWERAAGVERG